jgi:lichenan operon transcriptional antiterminator
MSDFTMDDRLIKIIKLIRKKPYCSLEYLAETLGVSTRTIRNYMKQLNSDLDGIASLENEKGKGYCLHIKNEPLFNDFIEKIRSEKNRFDSPQKRVAFIIDRLINHEGHNTLDEMAFNMNISRTTLVNELKKAAVVLETYNLSIRGKPNSGMYLSGNELDLRFFILDNVYDHLYSGYPLDEDIKAEITKIAHQHDLETTTQTRLMHSVIVMLDRLLKNHPLKKVHEKFHKLLATKEYQFAQDIAKAIETKLPIAIPEPEILFITIPIAGRRTPMNNRTLAEIAVTEEIRHLLDLIIEQVGFDKEILQENEEFFRDLQYHITFMINRLMFNVKIHNPLLDDVKEKYPVAFKMAEIAGKVIEKEYNLIISEDELGYLAFYFGVFIAQTEAKSKTLRHVAVICGTGRGTAKLVAMQLKRVLNPHTTIDLYSELEATKALLEGYDMVFSTVKLGFDLDVPLIMVNEIFDEYSVSRQIEKVTFLKKFKLEDSGNHFSIIKLLSNEEKFFILNPQKSYRENVDEMVDKLVRKGYFDTDFKNRLLEREEKGSMAFDRYIALPHTVNYSSNKVQLAIGVSGQPVQADGKEIKLIFLLGIPKQTDNDAGLLVKIYDEIIKIAADQTLIARLAQAASFTELSKIMEDVGKT